MRSASTHHRPPREHRQRRRWLRRTPVAILLGLLPLRPVGAQGAEAKSKAPASEWTLARLLEGMRQRPHARARFVERQFLALLDAPVDSSGELQFDAPDRLIKRTIKPRPELLAIEGNQMTVERDGLKRSASTMQMPGVAALVESLRATLAGNRGALERVFTARLQGDRARWTLDLTPRLAEAAQVVRAVRITGMGNAIDTVEIDLADGDRSVMRILDLR